MPSKINWINHLIELLVVIIGISIAFSLNNWRERAKTSNLEIKYLKSFQNDLKSDLHRLTEVIPANEQKLQRIKDNIFEYDVPEKWVMDSVTAVITDMLIINTFVRKKSTYESIKNSGNLNIISNYSLQTELIDYYTLFGQLAETERIYDSWLNQFIIPFVQENMDILKQKIMRPEAVLSYRFKNLVAGYYALLGQNNDIYQQVMESRLH